jgi:hypothetical protein
MTPRTEAGASAAVVQRADRKMNALPSSADRGVRAQKNPAETAGLVLLGRIAKR